MHVRTYVRTYVCTYVRTYVCLCEARHVTHVVVSSPSKSTSNLCQKARSDSTGRGSIPFEPPRGRLSRGRFFSNMCLLSVLTLRP